LPEDPSDRRGGLIYFLCLVIFLAFAIIHCVRVLTGERVPVAEAPAKTGG
jgi:hypothetical protein